MESSDVITSYLHEEDILSSLLDTAKEASSDYPINYNYLDFGLVDLSPSPGACLPDVKLDKELGEFEDEGFEGKKERETCETDFDYLCFLLQIVSKRKKAYYNETSIQAWLTSGLYL